MHILDVISGNLNSILKAGKISEPELQAHAGLLVKSVPVVYKTINRKSKWKWKRGLFIENSRGNSHMRKLENKCSCDLWVRDYRNCRWDNFGRCLIARAGTKFSPNATKEGMA